jgi:chemotaxis protein CheD
MKYGLFSVESMLNEMYKLGCKKQNITCKIAGGADIMGIDIAITNSIGSRNVKFAYNFCKTEGFKVVSDHTRGTNGRIILVGNDFETFIKYVKNQKIYNDVLDLEKSLHSELSQKNIYNPKTNGLASIELF